MFYGETFFIFFKCGLDGVLVLVDVVGGTFGMVAMIELSDEIWFVWGDFVDVVIDQDTKFLSVWKF